MLPAHGNICVVAIRVPTLYPYSNAYMGKVPVGVSTGQGFKAGYGVCIGFKVTR